MMMEGRKQGKRSGYVRQGKMEKDDEEYQDIMCLQPAYSISLLVLRVY